MMHGQRNIKFLLLCLMVEGSLNSKYFSRTSIDGEVIFVSLHDHFSIK